MGNEESDRLRSSPARQHAGRVQRAGFDLTDWIAYLTIAVSGAVGLLGIPSLMLRWIAFGILVVLCILRARFWLSDLPEDRRMAQIYLLVCVLLIGALLVLSSSSYFIPVMFFVWSVDAMLLLPLPQALGWVALFGVAAGTNFFIRDGWLTGIQNTLLYVSGYLFMGVFSHSLYRSQAEQKRNEALLEELQAANRRLQDYADRIEMLAVSQERNRMAREMHDTVGHHLTVSAVQLEAAQRLVTENPAKAAQMLGTVRSQVGEALAEIRGTVSRLRTPLEADLPLPGAVRRAAQTWKEATGLGLHLDIQDDLGPLSTTQRMALFRAAQEALTNIQRHARAERVWLSLRAEGDQLCLIVRDDGVGPQNCAGGQDAASERQTGGYGLLGMQERAAQLGGAVQFAPWKDEQGACRGSRLSFCLPRKEIESGGEDPDSAGG